MRRILLISVLAALPVFIEQPATAQATPGCVDNHDVCPPFPGRDCSGWLYVDKTGGGTWFASEAECKAHEAKVSPKKAAAPKAKKSPPARK